MGRNECGRGVESDRGSRRESDKRARKNRKGIEKRIKAQHVFSSFVECRMPVVDRKRVSQRTSDCFDDDGL